MDEATDRAWLRAQIRPYPREAHYLTAWNGSMTFAEIQDSLTSNINRLMRYYHYVEVDIPDMIQHGFMRLWEALSANPQMLATLDHGDAAAWVMYRSGSPHYRKFYRREMYLEELATRSGDPDEFVIDGYDHGYRAGHAQFAAAVEVRIDIEQAMKQMAEKYMDSREHLMALYYITTSVSLEDAAELAERGGTKKSWWLTTVVKPMREELCELLGLSRPGKVTWQQKVQAGHEEPLLELVRTYETKGNERMAETLRSLSRHEDCKVLMEKLNLPKSHIHYLRSNAHKELNRAYACRT